MGRRMVGSGQETTFIPRLRIRGKMGMHKVMIGLVQLGDILICPFRACTGKRPSSSKDDRHKLGRYPPSKSFS